MGCPKIIDVDFFDTDDDRISRQMRVLINTQSEQRRRNAEREAKDAERTARIEARAERTRKAKRNYNAAHCAGSAVLIGLVLWGGIAGLIAPVIAYPTVCFGFAYFGARLALTVSLCRKGRERR